jgi:hypothetical protein
LTQEGASVQRLLDEAGDQIQPLLAIGEQPEMGGDL